ncbi:uncharacterized protein BP01DRAFT_351174 [Aspergillus saccharolyticus JOP 1030-1]|uniref:Uncharacterized protein n=1 Tax=Aspergillus saccharolyticus JOP 1030-1 TaxID=1450539 RepID=A0A318Z2D8_9EURO|nr:hypothetical protein BP01DRAFT_351174 [Aspergillus saccharolyticus JOP 1030-1]PYH40534.1 hypothetical protein BP01DRAFT_351174 [Aspergillus saccharolyticus JOP 1030-1]
MGSFLSVSVHHQSKDKRQRRSNRLSKPPPKQATVESPVSTYSASQQHQLSAESSSMCLQPAAAWQNPWTGASIPVNTYNPGSSGRRSHSLPSATSHPGTPWAPVYATRKCQSIVNEPRGSVLRSPAVSTRGSSTMSQRASLQAPRQGTFRSATFRGPPQSPLDQHLRRSYSAHSPSHRTHSAISRSTIEEAKSSNTHFMVDNQGFSLIRRRSLLTRPGVATRRSTKELTRRHTPRVGPEREQPNNHTGVPHTARQGCIPDTEDYTEEHTPRQPTMPLDRLRPPTPNEIEYTHLGALKLGSLRVVNGSASPCPSDRARHKCPGSTDPGMLSDCISEAESVHFERQDRRRVTPEATFNDKQSLPSTQRALTRDEIAATQAYPSSLSGCRPTTFPLQIPSSAYYPQNEDLPASPFSFEKSPTISQPLELGISAPDAEVPVSHNDRARAFPPQGCLKGTRYGRPRSPHQITDGGHNLITSVRCSHNDQAGKWSPSRVLATSDFRRLSPRRGDVVGNVQPLTRLELSDSGKKLRMHRQLSLRVSSSRHGLEAPNRPALMSSMCHETQQQRHLGRFRSTSLSILRDSHTLVSNPQYCGQLRSREGVSANLDCVPASTQRSNTATLRSLVGISNRGVYRAPYFESGASSVNVHDPFLNNHKEPVSHPGTDSYFALRLPGGLAVSNLHCPSVRSCPSLSEDGSTSTSQVGTTSDCGTQSGASSSSRSSVHSDSWLPISATGTRRLSVAEEELKPYAERSTPIILGSSRSRI